MRKTRRKKMGKGSGRRRYDKQGEDGYRNNNFWKSTQKTNNEQAQKTNAKELTKSTRGIREIK